MVLCCSGLPLLKDIYCVLRLQRRGTQLAGAQLGLHRNSIFAVMISNCVQNMFLTAFLFLSFSVSGDGVILICSSCDLGVPKSQTI